jgi:hypothetical protein
MANPLNLKEGKRCHVKQHHAKLPLRLLVLSVPPNLARMNAESAGMTLGVESGVGVLQNRLGRREDLVIPRPKSL